MPEQGKPNNFSGAVGKFDFVVSTSKQKLLLSEAFQLNLEIRGTGNFNLFNFPSINLPSSLEVYEPEKLEKIKSKKSEKINSKKLENLSKDKYFPVIQGVKRCKLLQKLHL